MSPIGETNENIIYSGFIVMAVLLLIVVGLKMIGCTHEKIDPTKYFLPEHSMKKEMVDCRKQTILDCPSFMDKVSVQCTERSFKNLYDVQLKKVKAMCGVEYVSY